MNSETTIGALAYAMPAALALAVAIGAGFALLKWLLRPPAPERKWAVLLATSVACNIFLIWYGWDHMREAQRAWREHADLSQQLSAVSRAFPERAYSRNELALRLAAPAYVPLVMDCMVRYHDTMFVFDRNNVLVALTTAKSLDAWAERNGVGRFKCDDASLAKLSEPSHYERMSERYGENARKNLSELFAKDDPRWGIKPDSASGQDPDKR